VAIMSHAVVHVVDDHDQYCCTMLLLRR
jgi:hypothetical protein